MRCFSIDFFFTRKIAMKHMLVRALLGALVLCGLGLSETKVEGPVVLFIGPPGSGKTTQAAAAARLLKVPVVAAEDLIKDNPATFDKIRRTGISGMEPQTDPVLNRLFSERLEKGDLSRGMVLDGYPSTKDHADYVTALVKKGVLPSPFTIELQVPDDTVRKRTKKASKDPPASVEQRLKDYHREMDMVRTYFPDAEIVTIDGTKSIKKVTREISALLKKRYKI
jgi:adenylate kinase